MKKYLSLIFSVVFGILGAASSIVAHEVKSGEITTGLQNSVEASTYLSASIDSPTVSADIIPEEIYSSSTSELAMVQFSSQEFLTIASEEDIQEITPVEETETGDEVLPIAVSVSIKPKNKTILARGGEAPESSTTVKKTSTAADTSKYAGKKVEVLDWWKSGSSAFPIGATATVKDVYSGRTFKIKRTMGSNHADCEALTLADTKIIKSIWGGFSWDVRPIHIYINGRILAASMSSQPHAGVDSAPAFAAVRNRSEGYGAGQNLDVIKENGMDGHFDVHFLNSTRHKDGDEDSRHQSAIKVAAKK